jgi:hypothetical protein
MDAHWQVVGLSAPKSISRCPCRTRKQRLARVVRRRGRCGGRFFLGWDAFSSTAFFTRAICRKRFHASSRLSPSRVVLFSVAWEFIVFSYVSSARFVYTCTASLNRAMDSITLLLLLDPLPILPCPRSCSAS